MVERTNTTIYTGTGFAPKKLPKAAMYLSLENTQAGGKCWAQNVANIPVFNNAGFPEFFSGGCGCDKTMRNAITCSYIQGPSMACNIGKGA